MSRWNPVDQMQDLVNKMGGEDAIKRFLSGELVLAERETPKLLSQVSSVSVPAVSRFVAKDHFAVDTGKKAKVKIGWLGENFKKHFLGKTEENVPATDLALYTLTKNSLNVPILAELGDRAETTLVHLWHLLSQQANDQSGTLLTNGYWNVFYIRDINGNLWAVDARWDAGCGGWDVEAGSVGSPSRWGAGHRVGARK